MEARAWAGEPEVSRSLAASAFIPGTVCRVQKDAPAPKGQWEGNDLEKSA